MGVGTGVIAGGNCRPAPAGAACCRPAGYQVPVRAAVRDGLQRTGTGTGRRAHGATHARDLSDVPCPINRDWRAAVPGRLATADAWPNQCRRILHQNRSSVAYLGYLVGRDRNAAAAAAATAASRAKAGPVGAEKRQIQPPPPSSPSGVNRYADRAGGAEWGVGPGGGASDRNTASPGWQARLEASLTASLGASAAGLHASGGPNRLQQLFAHDPTKLHEILQAVAEGMVSGGTGGTRCMHQARRHELTLLVGTIARCRSGEALCACLLG